jgi:UDP-2,3-diacylglucosamine pyrophosphatase LpxH
MIRILSDLHLYEPQSRVLGPHALEPLFEGVSALVLNGDSCDTQHGRGPAAVQDMLNAFRQALPRLVVITGNHDPDISDVHEMSLADGEVWITHGDVVFDDLVPWSRGRHRYALEVANSRRGRSESDETIHGRLQLFREVCFRVAREPHPVARGLGGTMRGACRMLAEPSFVWRVLRAWQAMPRLAGALADLHRPSARYIVTGHVHRCGCWSLPGGQTVVNTGAFVSMARPWCVDVSNDRLVVREVNQRGPHFHPGAVRSELPLQGPLGRAGPVQLS